MSTLLAVAHAEQAWMPAWAILLPDHQWTAKSLSGSYVRVHYVTWNIRCRVPEHGMGTDWLVSQFRHGLAFLACLTHNITNRADISSIQLLNNCHTRRVKKWVGRQI